MERVAALAVGKGVWTADDDRTLVGGLERAEHLLPSLRGSDESRLAIDLQAVHARLRQSLERAAPPCEEPRLRLSLLGRLVALLEAIEARAARRFAPDRARIAGGRLRGDELLAWIARLPPDERDTAVEQLLGIAFPPLGRARLHPELVGYIPSGVAPIVQAIRLVPIGPEDVVVDIGAGLGKVALLVHLLTGARVRGIELQPDLVAAARQRATALDLGAISFEQCDARAADLSGASVVYLYLPFTGATLAAALERIRAAASQRSLVVCSLGLDLAGEGWLRERPLDELWLSIYDSSVPAASPRVPSSLVLASAAAAAVGAER